MAPWVYAASLLLQGPQNGVLGPPFLPNNPNLLLLYKGRHTTRRAHHKRVPESAPGESWLLSTPSARAILCTGTGTPHHTCTPCRARHTHTCTRANLAPSCAHPAQGPAHAHSHSVFPALRDEVHRREGVQGCTHTDIQTTCAAITPMHTESGTHRARHPPPGAPSRVGSDWCCCRPLHHTLLLHALFNTRRMVGRVSPPPHPRPSRTWQIVPQWTHTCGHVYTPHTTYCFAVQSQYTAATLELVAQLPTTGGGIEAGSTQNAPGRGTGTQVLAAHCQWSNTPHRMAHHTIYTTKQSTSKGRVRA